MSTFVKTSAEGDDTFIPFIDADQLQQNDVNISLDIEKMAEILQGFYHDFISETNYILIVLYIPIIFLAITANMLVIAVVFKYHYMRSVTNYFVVNLSIADLLVTLICMPMAISQAVSIIWVYGELMCKLFFYLQGVAVAASVFTITAMSIDRYLAIRSPIAFRRIFNRKSTIIVIVVLWVVSLSIFSPVLIAVTLQSPIKDLDNITVGGEWELETDLKIQKPPEFYVCSEDFKALGINAYIFGTSCFILVYATPGFVVLMAYAMMGRTLCSRKPPFDGDSTQGSASSQQGFRLVRERKRVAWILLLLAVLFALCWLPYNVLRLLADLGIVREGKLLSDVLSYCLFLGHANSALNPIVYCFMTRNFRRSAAEILCRRTYHLTGRNPRHKALGSTVGVGVKWNNGKFRAVNYRSKACPGLNGSGNTLTPGIMLPSVPKIGNVEAGIGQTAVPATQATLGLQKRTASTTSSSGYSSYYSVHNPHRRCYTLKSSPRGISQDSYAKIINRSS